MKCLFILLCFTCASLLLSAQTEKPKGNFFTMKRGEYFEKVIKPWRYQYTPAKENHVDSVNRIGQITFWRSQAIYDSGYKKLWKPDISYDVFSASDLEYVNRLANKITPNTTCDTINRGGDLLFVGNFILISQSECVNCASSAKIDYCRTLIKRLFAYVPDKDTHDWRVILGQMIIDSGRFRN